MESKEYTCIHEEQIQKQSRTIERINAELNYKKEKLEEIKQDNDRMEIKIDEIKNCINKLIIKSNNDDDKLNNRLIAIETEQKVIKELQKQNREETNLKIALLGVILVIMQIYFNYFR